MKKKKKITAALLGFISLSVGLCSCSNKGAILRVKTGVGVVDAVNSASLYFSVGDEVFVRQDFKGGWEVLPNMSYQEGFNIHTFLFSKADSNEKDTLKIGVEYRRGVIVK